MSDKNFKDMDQKLMAAMKELREKEVSDGILKGFSASVERRLLARKRPEVSSKRLWSPAWAPVLAVMVLASAVVLRSPVVLLAPSGPQPVEYAQLDPSKPTDIEEEIAALSELGAWSDEDDSLVSGSADVTAQDIEQIALNSA